jgi:hypothetical protein
MASFAWVAGGIVVLVGLIALIDLLGGRRASKSMLRRPPQDPRKQARIRGEGAGQDGPQAREGSNSHTALDSNSSNRRLASATGDSAEHSHDPQLQHGICPA